MPETIVEGSPDNGDREVAQGVERGQEVDVGRRDDRELIHPAHFHAEVTAQLPGSRLYVLLQEVRRVDIQLSGAPSAGT
jgi:hypothetical protein